MQHIRCLEPSTLALSQAPLSQAPLSQALLHQAFSRTLCKNVCRGLACKVDVAGHRAKHRMLHIKCGAYELRCGAVLSLGPQVRLHNSSRRQVGRVQLLQACPLIGSRVVQATRLQQRGLCSCMLCCAREEQCNGMPTSRACADDPALQCCRPLRKAQDAAYQMQCISSAVGC
jgi:hypothetical protein